MSLQASEVKRRLQDHLQEGLLLVVGAGLSMAEGLPGMSQLAEHLKLVVPGYLATNPDPNWDRVVAELDSGAHLEAAMAKHSLHSSTVDAIVMESAQLVGAAERIAIESSILKKRTLPFTMFASHLFKAAKRFHLITPNYVRLVEVATEAAGIGVNSRFVGYLHGRLDARCAADAHRESYISNRQSRFRDLPCLFVHKPHGSLDWYDVGSGAVRCPVPLQPVIITPGASKYRESFRRVFDDQRISGIHGAEQATRFMFIGYGFNDDHLEQALCPNFALKRPSIILARSLTQNAQLALERSTATDVIALSAAADSDRRTLIRTSLGETLEVNEDLWSLEGFNKGVL